MAEFILIVFGYLFGSIPWGYLLCRIFTGKDVRNYGSGNIGATNVYRVAGGRIAAAVFILDALKGFLPVFIAKQIFGITPVYLVFTGIAALLGHNFTLFLKGKGGKGVATSFGVITALFPLAALISIIAWTVAAFTTRYVSAGSLFAALILPFSIYFLSGDLFYSGVGAVIFILIAFSHRANIGRLLSGKENKMKLPWEKA